MSPADLKIHGSHVRKVGLYTEDENLAVALLRSGVPAKPLRLQAALDKEGCYIQEYVLAAWMPALVERARPRTGPVLPKKRQEELAAQAAAADDGAEEPEPEQATRKRGKRAAR